MRTVCLLIAFASLAGCAAQPATHPAPPFTMSSETSGFTVRGTLSGTVEIQSKQLVIVVNEGAIHSRTEEQPAITLMPIIAGAGSRDARRVAEGSPQLVGAFSKDERRVLTGPMKFTIPLPADFDPENQWLVFEFGLEKRSTTYVCETGNLLGPEASGSSKRNGWVCW
jgi:hypothetical protein